MKGLIIKGFKLFMVSAGYIFLSAIYFDSLWKSVLAIQLGSLIGVGFLSLWFYYGFKMCVGFKDGLLVGTVGAAGGIVLTVLSILLLLQNTPDGGPFFIMIPWVYPFLGLFNVIPYFGMINNYLPHLSVVIVVLLTAVGSWLGKRQNEEKQSVFKTR
jgi:hypothetical protein